MSVSSFVQNLLLKGTLRAYEALVPSSPTLSSPGAGTPTSTECSRVLGSAERVRFIHISDLHFGAEDVLKVSAFDRVLGELDPHFVLVTGDFVETPTRENFRKANAFLERLRAKRSVFVVPGNHDRHGELDLSSWRAGIGVTTGDYGYDELKIRLANGTTFPIFIFRFCSPLGPRDTEAVRVAFLERLIQVQGWVDREQLEYFAKVARTLDGKLAYRQGLKIACIHHHPIPTKRASQSDRFMTIANAAEFLETLDELRVDLVLHGHQHDPLVTELRREQIRPPLVVAAAGTTFRRTETTDPGKEEERRSVVSQFTSFYDFGYDINERRLHCARLNYTNNHADPWQQRFVHTKRMWYPPYVARDATILSRRVSWVISPQLRADETVAYDWIVEETYRFVPDAEMRRWPTWVLSNTVECTWDQLQIKAELEVMAVPGKARDCTPLPALVTPRTLGHHVEFRFEFPIDFANPLSPDHEYALTVRHRWPNGFYAQHKRWEGTLDGFAMGCADFEWTIRHESLKEGVAAFQVLPPPDVEANGTPSVFDCRALPGGFGFQVKARDLEPGTQIPYFVQYA